MSRNAHPKRAAPAAVFLCALPFAAILASLFFGRYFLSPAEVLSALFRPDTVSRAAVVTVLLDSSSLQRVQYATWS